MIANVAYNDVKREPGGEAAAVYEDIDKMVRTVQGKDTLTRHPEAAYELPVSRPDALEHHYSTAGEIAKARQQQHRSTETAM